jgi:serine/threonine-protein kinase PknK
VQRQLRPGISVGEALPELRWDWIAEWGVNQVGAFRPRANARIYRAIRASLPTVLIVSDRRLELLRLLGRGATSRVFLAKDERSQELLVAKLGVGASARAALAREAERHAWIRTSELVPLLGVGRAQAPTKLPGQEAGQAAALLPKGAPVLLFPWLEGVVLEVAGERRTQAEEPESAALELAVRLGRALQALHDAGFAHGDLKPDNLWLPTRGGRPSFGAAKLLDLGLSSSVTREEPLGGSLRYLEPQGRGPGFGDARSRDLWALGLLLSEVGSRAVAESQEPLRVLGRVAFGRELGGIVRALLRPSAGARPDAGWVAQQAASALGLRVDDEPQAFGERLRGAYLRARSGELRSSFGKRVALQAGELERKWLGPWASVSEGASEFLPQASGQVTLHALEPEGLQALLVGLAGPQAAGWQLSNLGSVGEVLERLDELVRHTDPRALSLKLLGEAMAGGRAAALGAASRARPKAGSEALDLVELGAQLADAGVTDQVLDQAEALLLHQEGLPATLRLMVARRLRLRGQFGRALSLTSDRSDKAQVVFAAETLRRGGELAEAEALLEELRSEPELAAPLLSQSLATQARLCLDRDEASRGLALLESAPKSSAVSAVQAQLEVALGLYKKARVSAERARVLALDDEERARADGVLGFVLHALGDAEAELMAFQRASSYAARAGAVLEEAHYLTGVAAAGAQVGSYEDALQAARRARCLFDWAKRSRQAARACQAEAAVLAALGVYEQARAIGADAIFRARQAGDDVCRAYVHLTFADMLEPSREGQEHVERAAQLLGGAVSIDDRLRLAARRLKHESVVDIAEVESWCRRAQALDAVFDWWRERAVAAQRSGSPGERQAVLAELVALSTVRAPVGVRGPTFVEGARLAATLGDGEATRRLFVAAGDAAREVRRGVSGRLKTAVEALAWVQLAEAARDSSLVPEQLAEVEALVRALSTQESPRRLFHGILDTLVLWTGVERALLLLPSPSGRLVVRAARNLGKEELVPRQLELSRSLARRAMEQGKAVVAVDAVGDLPEIHESVHALNLRSVLAVPLTAKGRTLGVVYLDDRIKRGAFGHKELAWVRFIASLAAVALSDLRAQLLLRRAARRSLRAEARVRRELSERQAELEQTQRELSRISTGRPTRFAYSAIIGESQPILELLALLDRVAPADVPVLICGESGSGKELVAQALHASSPRAAGPFVSENCSAIPEGLLESALFGHSKGAFTGAVAARRGLFEQAHSGTLFLDEIGEMSLSMQTKLLRVLEDGLVRAVGSQHTRKVDVRVIVATHRELERRVQEGSFRRDLLYRLNVISLSVPPLRARIADVPLLVEHFVARYSPDRPRKVSRAAMTALVAYPWPGNVRQLQNELRRALVMAEDEVLLEHLSPELRGVAGPGVSGPMALNLKARSEALERELVALALERARGNQTQAAALLGVSRFGLQKMLRRLEIRVVRQA